MLTLPRARRGLAGLVDGVNNLAIAATPNFVLVRARAQPCMHAHAARLEEGLVAPLTPRRALRAQDAADDVNFVGKKIGLSLSKFGNTLKDGFTVHQRSTTAGALAHNTAAAAGEADDDSELPPEPDGLRDLITARARACSVCGAAPCALAADRRSRAADGAACLCSGVCDVQRVLDSPRGHAAAIRRGAPHAPGLPQCMTRCCTPSMR
jgi:hypothetical protein